MGAIRPRSHQGLALELTGKDVEHHLDVVAESSWRDSRTSNSLES
jgi:hypothetical protein